ncbi:DNA topology modulation protein [Vagococcus xieshaowenii]|uniref:DNA topology modulation protein n=1 Tax=Vagococcus xieshaowenii TaxID=2562451 RepID=A0AAJ5EF30_9ENTE|nr:DNA topology modulation protein [Vagococcus xieshaowenii]QCA28603.1 DNA topology modulation protein [Vagococcus xieshaowenii]TFZ40589.1 DNA topology modulation protein [Vagococcus xieshaowenii]
MKIAIIGYSGSGKSTLAKAISQKINIPLLHLDTVQFEANWQERDNKEANTIVKQFMAQKDWIIDGNYSKFFKEERLEKADTIIILAFSRWACLKRVIKRYFKYRKTSRPDMAEGCREKLDGEFIWWVLYRGRKKQPMKDFIKIQQIYSDKTIILHNQQELDDYYQKHELTNEINT